MDSTDKNVNASNDKVFCKRCGRPLVGEHSRSLGYGPTCYRLWKLERSQNCKLFDVGDSHGKK